jgi:acetylornithine deacetylase
MSSVIDTLAALVRINSVNPAYGDGGTEENVVPFIREFFESRGIETFTQEVFPGRHNIIARLPGKTSRRIVFEAHMDTVSIKGMTIEPFDPVIKEGRMHGRGSVDDKAGLAAMMHAVASFKEGNITPECEVWMAAVVDEEYSFRGVVKLCEGLKADASIVAEPTEMRAVIASKGVLRWRIVVRGKAAHSSKPHLGVNAISHMSRLVLALEAENERLAVRTHPLLGPGTLNVGVIHGGVQVNFVPDQCSNEIDQRLLPGESATAALSRCQEIIDQLAQQHPGFEAFIEDPPLLVDEALDTPPNASTALVAQQVLRQMELNDTVCGVPFGSDASKLSRAGIPTIVFGPGSIDQAHGADEYVPLAEVLQATEFYRQFIENFR